MKVVAIIVLVVIAVFLFLPILFNPAIIPKDLSPSEIGGFLGGYLHYWVAAFKELF